MPTRIEAGKILQEGQIHRTSRSCFSRHSHSS